MPCKCLNFIILARFCLLVLFQWPHCSTKVFLTKSYLLPIHKVLSLKSLPLYGILQLSKGSLNHTHNVYYHSRFTDYGIVFVSTLYCVAVSRSIESLIIREQETHYCGFQMSTLVHKYYKPTHGLTSSLDLCSC